MEQALQKLNIWQAGGIGVLLAVFYFFMFFKGGSQAKQVESIFQEELEYSKNQLVEAKKAMANKDQYKKDIIKLETDYKKLAEYLPAKYDEEKLLELLSDIAEKSKVTSIKVLEESGLSGGPGGSGSSQAPQLSSGQSGLVSNHVFEVSLVGGYNEVITFLSSAVNTKPILRLRSLTLIPQAEGGENTAVVLKAIVGFVVYELQKSFTDLKKMFENEGNMGGGGPPDGGFPGGGPPGGGMPGGGPPGGGMPQ